MVSEEGRKVVSEGGREEEGEGRWKEPSSMRRREVCGPQNIYVLPAYTHLII